MNAMKWRKATASNQKGETFPLENALDCAEGYRIVRHPMGFDRYRYSAWKADPDLPHPHLKMINAFDSSEEAKQACKEHHAGGV